MTSLKSIINPKSCSVLPQKFLFSEFQIQKKDISKIYIP